MVSLENDVQQMLNSEFATLSQLDQLQSIADNAPTFSMLEILQDTRDARMPLSQNLRHMLGFIAYISLSHDMWKALIDQKRFVLLHLHSSNGEELQSPDCFIHIKTLKSLRCDLAN